MLLYRPMQERIAVPMPMAPLERLGLHRPELRAWALYDWANSAVVTTIIAAVFPIYYIGSLPRACQKAWLQNALA